MGKERTVPFGSRGQYSREERTKEEARRYFLRMVQEACPEVLVDLRDTVFPLYQSWAKQARRKYHPRLVGIAHPVFRAIAGWGKRFHLMGELPRQPDWHGEQWHEYARAESLWPWQKALEALYVWHWLQDGPRLRNSDPPRWPEWSTVESGSGDQFTLHLVVAGFVPDQPVTASAYVQQVLAKAKVILSAYVERQRQRAEASGQKRTARKYSPEHFTWLALRQVWGWSDRQIADWHRSRTSLVVTADAVRHGIRLAAKLIELKLRPFKRGRPRIKK